MGKGVPKNIVPINPRESSTMTCEESEEKHHQLSKLENKYNEMGDNVLKKVDLSCLQDLGEMDQKMEQLQNSIDQKMDKKMEQLQNSMLTMILHTLNERFSKEDIWMQGNHENVDNIKIESQKHDYSSLQDLHHREFNSAPKNYLILNIDMRKFDGREPLTWIFHVGGFFDLHQVSTSRNVTLAFVYLDPDQFVWYQWLCE
jgi:hypothetical protein